MVDYIVFLERECERQKEKERERKIPQLNSRSYNVSIGVVEMTYSLQFRSKC